MDKNKPISPRKIQNKKRKKRTLNTKLLVEIILTSLLFWMVAIGYLVLPKPFFIPTIESTRTNTPIIFNRMASILAKNLTKKSFR
ncbi:hypothetical protein [Carnobacterium divergens]|uniref:hypothetical protein n=1 Tax=Carnobacterium divergens TaxID=2748 RepID=UPI001EE8E498|nr:hypothetical protein [Carnobacterium divergens]